jgi:hypothetical protein
VKLEVTVTDLHNVNKTRLPVWSGWVALNGSDGFNCTLLCLGTGGSLSNKRALATLKWGCREPSRVVRVPDEIPILQVGIGMGLHKVVLDVIGAVSGKVLGQGTPPEFERVRRVSYLVS